ncbi:hypothetical protein JOC77_000910 [Peribacillus deserti]|uniref:Uncharacterized protein n=1 Tax=Peribacillus deserti TaxID=673318 RepID=A0ABS2QEB7_9BACI|nr:hypothetical protein [Peribacillus deserti]MBM7691505.1 hypothetical protein [Peribacillus deserti]
MMGIHPKVSASKWVEVQPQEVIDRSVLTITGTYDFSSKPKTGDFVFEGYEFKINKVYKGESSQQIIAGIDMFDKGWAEEFLLFLENREEGDFLVPVGGPNGMIKIMDDKVIHRKEEKVSFFEFFLKAPATEPKSI